MLVNTVPNVVSETSNNGIEFLPHPSYSPDIAPFEIFLLY